MKPDTANHIDPELVLSTQVAQGLTVIGDHWSLLIIREMYLGERRFETLRRRLDIARGTLSARLKSLVGRGLLLREVYHQRPVRHAYRLTPMGLDLYPVVLMLWRWEHDWGDASYLPTVLVHTECGRSMRPKYRCAHCHQDVEARDMDYTVGQQFRKAPVPPPRYQRRIRSRPDAQVGGAVLDCFGDRWTSLVLAAAFFGQHRFEELRAAIGASTNILADRLRKLQHMGVIDRVPYSDRPLRHAYYLSSKGRALYAATLAIHEWSNRWLIEPGQEPLVLRHRPCKKRFEGEVVCSDCAQPLAPHAVGYDHGKDTA